MWPGPAGFNHKRAKMSTTSSMIYCPRQPMIKSWRSRDTTSDGYKRTRINRVASLWPQQRERQQIEGEMATARER
jgi:hypothetical protein